MTDIFLGDFDKHEVSEMKIRFKDLSGWTFWRYEGGFHCHHMQWGYSERVFGETIDDMLVNLSLNNIGVGSQK